MVLRNVIKAYEILKKRARKELEIGDYERSYMSIRQAASLAIQFNWRYEDDELESLMARIAQVYLPTVPDTMEVKDERLVLIDDFCRSFILVLQYLDAFKTMGKRVLYIVTSSDMAYGSSKSILDRVKAYPNVETYVADDKMSMAEKTSAIYAKIVSYSPSKVFLHVNELSPALFTLYRLPRSIQRYMINLSDQRFWLGAKAIDFSLEFRPFGATISRDFRGLRSEQLLMVPFYPVVDGNPFKGFPEVSKGKVIIFSGGDFYKTISPNNDYWRVVKYILDENPRAVILFAIKAQMNKAAKFVNDFIRENHYEDRFISIGFRDDINEVFAHSDIFLGTCPTSGSLMTQLAAWNKKPILQLYLPGTCDDETEQAVCYNDQYAISYTDISMLLKEAKHLIENVEYRNLQGERLYNSMIKPWQFNQLLADTLITNVSCVTFKDVDNDPIVQRWLWLDEYGYIDAEGNIIGLIGTTEIRKLMPTLWLKRKIKNFINMFK